MAKRKKLQDNNPPRRVEIRGQDHLLAYITPEEAQLLMANGGTGEAGPMGIPSYPEPGMGGSSDSRSGSGNSGSSSSGSSSSGSSSSGSSSSGSSSGSGDGGRDGNDDDEAFSSVSVSEADRAAAAAAARANLAESIAQYGGGTMDNPMANSAMTAADFAFTPNTYDLTSQAINNLGVARGGLRSLAGLTRAQYGAMPSYMQNIYDKTGAYNFEFGPQGRVTGFYGPPGGSPFPGLNMLGQGIVSLTDMLLGPPMTEEDLALRSVYTGFGEGSQPDGGRDGGPEPEVKPVDPVTGQCDEGYIFDEDLQACRLDTRGGASTPGGVGSVVPPTDGAYARMGLLDVAPTGLPQFQQQYGAGFGTPQDFAAANLNFRRQGATYPEYFQRPPQLSGYTLLS
jgi:hypothetical protein